MTLEEDVALLREEVDRLRVIDRDKSRRLEDLESQIALWNVNGAENLLGGYGFTQIGRKFRFYPIGLQVLSDTDYFGISWIPAFNDDFNPNTDVPFTIIYGNADASVASWNQVSKLNAEDSTNIRTTAAPNDASVRLSAGTTDNNAVLLVKSLNAAGGYYVQLDATPLWLGVFTTDPAVLSDGMVWYRSDTDKFRGRANGATLNFAMEGTSVLGDGSEITIATGAITITSGYHRVDTQADGATDDLDTINGGITGQILVLRAENDARDVVVKDGTGNIQCAGDMTLDNVQDSITLIYNGSAWLELARSNNGA